MISLLINNLYYAFTDVVDLVGDFFGQEGVFGAIDQLSSQVF